MASVNAVWGIDVGQCALKALRLQLAPDGSVEVTHFDLIEHPKILSQPDAETDQLIQNALDKFLSRNEIGKARVAVAVPGQSSFARFVKLPPVEAKRIPEIVKFEAVQQIPFDIEEVEWDYQTFMSPTSPEVEVGIFAMRKELVLKHISYLRAAGIEPDVVQLAPLSLYNMMTFDGLVAKQGATILVDVGAENTDLVISDGDRIWLRSIPLGGNSFTEALVKAFKLPFSKAESFKRTAATNKYARQIFVAMRPVFSDLVSEVQRSIGFYTSLHRDAQITRVLCLGNAFRLPGLEKFLGQNLQVETLRPNAFGRLKPSPTVNAPAFVENLWSFGVAYGLGVQALGQAPISSNLLPFSIARQRHWRAERPWFAAAAAVMVLGLGLTSWSAINKKAHAEEQQDTAKSLAQPTLQRHQQILSEKRELTGQGDKEVREIHDFRRLVWFRPIMPQVAYVIQNSVPNDWRTAAEAMAREKVGAGKPVDFRKDVWLEVGKKEFADQLARSGYIYLLESVNMELFQGKPPAIVKQQPVGPVPIGPGSQGPGGPGMPPPVEPGMGPGPEMGGYQPGGAAAAATGVASVGQQSGGIDEKYLRITLSGYTNTPQNMIAIELQNKLLSRVNAMYRQEPGGAIVAADPKLLSNIRLAEMLDVNKHAGFSRVSKPPVCWPQMEPPADPGAPAPVAAGGVGGLPAMAYPIINFKIVFDLQVVSPAATPAAGGESGPATGN